MNVLAIDTSGPVAGVAVVRDRRLAYEAVAINKLTHSVNLMPMVEQGLQNAGLSVNDLGLIACVTGPGSFTGVRIGVSAAKAMAYGLNIPCMGVNALEALAQIPFEGIVCPVLDARAGQVYGAAFLNNVRLMEDDALKLTDYLDQIQEFGEIFLFTGDGADAHREAIKERLGERAHFPPPHLNHLRPGAAAWLALQQEDKWGDYLQLSPFYLRAPQAERERAQRESLHGK